MSAVARTVCAVVLPRPGHGGAGPVLAALRAQSRAPDETVVVDQRASGVALSGALGSGSEWLWLLDGDAVPEPRALEHLVAALDAAKALPAPVLLTGKVLAPDGSLDPRSLPVAEVVRSDLVVGAVGRRLLAVRVARRGSLLVHRRAFERPPGAAACAPLDDDLAWTAGLLKHEPGLLVPASVAVRTGPAWGGATPAGSEHTRAGAYASRAELGRWLRLLSGDALAPRERAWFGFRLAELALATARTRLSRLTESRRELRWRRWLRRRRWTRWTRRRR